MAERAVSVEHAVELNGADREAEVVVLVRRRVRGRFLPLLAQHGDLGDALEGCDRGRPGERLVQALLHRGHRSPREHCLVDHELLPQPQAAVDLQLAVPHREGLVRSHQSRVPEVLRDLFLQARGRVVLLHVSEHFARSSSIELARHHAVAFPRASLLHHDLPALEHLHAFVATIRGLELRLRRVVRLPPLPAQGPRLASAFGDRLLVLLVLADVPGEELAQWPEHSVERVTRDVHASGRPDSVDAGLPRLARDQRDLAKVLADGVLHHLHLALVAHDASDCASPPKDVHHAVFIALLEDGFVLLEFLLPHDLSERCDLFAVELSEDIAPP
mmetsp:Transcript_88701/g.255781  ORF Transcript_88701/g.255781 Transcript_88701/m.255781 type:complete len:331 (+) Transcript_88701:841-1833(+)